MSNYYDEAGHGAGIGRLTRRSDASGETSWNYDLRGRVVQETRTLPGTLGTFVTGWSYNSADLATQMVYPGGNGGEAGEALSYTYNDQLGLDGVLGSFPTAYVLETGYDAAGRVVERSLGDAGLLTQNYEYHPWTQQGGRLGGLMTIAGANTLQELSYGYDAVGNITTITDDATFPGYPQTQTFTYDALDRLLSAQTTGGSAGDYGPESYTYDPTTGSLASKAGVSYTYGDALHKHAVTGLSNGSSFSYDANGNMITRTVGGQTFNLSYDAENRMTGVTGAATASFVYDDPGARVISAEGVTTTVYVGSYFEWHGTITDTVKYYYAGTVRVAMRKGEGPALFLLGDHLGSTNRLVHADGAPVTPGGVRLYKAWGESRYEPDGELATEYRYTGQFENGYIDLYWYGSRWLDPVFGRFTTPDSIIHEVNNTLDWDLYQYVRSNPIKYLDPSGHRPCDLNLDELCDHGIWQPTLAERYKGQLQEKFGWKNIDNLSETQLFHALQYQYAISNDSNLKPCTPIMPCLEPWSPPSSWDVNSKNPDYFALTITVGEGILGEIVIIFDRFGQIFVGPGGGVGVGTPISGSLTSGWILPDFNPRTPAGPSISSNFLSGVYANASAGFLGGMGITFTTNGSNDTAFELGFFSPSATFSVGNLWQMR